jgi:hypothetical protein
MTDLQKLRAAYNAARASTAWDALVDAPDAVDAAYAALIAFDAARAALAAQTKEQTDAE